MVTKVPEETKAPQSEVLIPAPAVKAPEAVEQQAKALMDRLVSKLQRQTDAYVKRMTAEMEKAQAGPEIGTVINAFPYWNCLTYGPYAFDKITFLPSRYMPNRVVAHDDYLFLYGLIWINPIAPPYSPPPTIQLGGRSYNIRFEAVNLSKVSDGPDGVISDTFTPVAPVVTPFYWQMPIPDPGATPNLYEVNVTVDLTLAGQPFATFGTWQFEPDTEPSFLGLPTGTPQWLLDRPIRFMVYHR